MSDRPESDGTVWTPPPSAGDLKREYEEMGRDTDGLEERMAYPIFVGVARVPWTRRGDDEPCPVKPITKNECRNIARAALAVAERERNSCLCEFRPDEQLDPTVECLYHRNLRERAVDAEEKHRYWHERYDREVSALRGRPSLTEELEFLREQLELKDSASVDRVLRALQDRDKEFDRAEAAEAKLAEAQLELARERSVVQRLDYGLAEAQKDMDRALIARDQARACAQQLRSALEEQNYG